MKHHFAALFAVLATQTTAADQTISFNNNNLGRPELVTFGPEFDQLAGSGLRNSVADGASFVAQLYLVASDDSLTPIGQTANFRAAETRAPGTWSGGSRVIPGVTPGQLIKLKVRAWDASLASFEAAKLGSKGVGESDVFTFQDPLSNPALPTDLVMANFKGFVVDRPGCSLTPGWFFTTPHANGGIVYENELWDIPDGTRDDMWPVSRDKWYWQLRYILPIQVAAVGGSLVETGGRLFYRHAPNTYGYVNSVQTGPWCISKPSGLWVQMPILSFKALPSPKRPYLALNPAGATKPGQLVLRGLAPKRYRVEKSADLAAWQPVGEFVANYSEVPVQELAPAKAEPQFFRAVELAE